MTAPKIVFLNGDLLPLEEARVSVLDRGFIFGDGVYEVIPVYSRQPFRLSHHLERLQHNLDTIRIERPMSPQQWESTIREIIARNVGDDQSIYVQITRGVAPRAHEFPISAQPTVFIMSTALSTPERAQVEHGVGCISTADFRWLRCDLKSISLLANCLLKQSAVDAHAAEVVLFRDGYLTEAATSNIFIISEDILLAPPKNHLILPGVTYDVVLELAQTHKIPHEIRPIPEQEARSAQELWLTSSSKEILAVTRLDGVNVGSGTPGAHFRRMYGFYQAFKQTVMRRAA
jgi:D-alanine transaminase